MIANKPIMLSVVKLSVIIANKTTTLSVVNMSVIMLRVEAPGK